MTECGELRKLMIEYQVTRRGVHGRALLDALQAVPREEFVESDLEEFAYDDSPLAIGHGQTISQPYIVARMLDEADIKPSDIVLEIGVGSGYAAAVASRMAAHVYGIERIFALSKQTRQTLDRLHYDNIDIRTGDGTTGWSEAGPFDVIIVSAGAPAIPFQLQEQLDIGGRMIIPVGPRSEQRLVKVVRHSATCCEETDLGGVRFVPLIGALGWEA